MIENILQCINLKGTYLQYPAPGFPQKKAFTLFQLLTFDLQEAFAVNAEHAAKSKSFSPGSEVQLQLDNQNATSNMKYYLYNQTYLTFTVGWGKCIHEFLAPLRWLNYV